MDKSDLGVVTGDDSNRSAEANKKLLLWCQNSFSDHVTPKENRYVAILSEGDNFLFAFLFREPH